MDFYLTSSLFNLHPFIMAPSFHFNLCVLFLFVCSFSLSFAQADTGLRWCSGTLSFRENSRVDWTSTSNIALHGSTLTYEICSSQSRGATYLTTGRIKVGAIDHYWPLCSSKLTCARESATKRSDGLFCLTGTTSLHFPSPAVEDVSRIDVIFYDVHGRDVVILCNGNL